MARLRLRPGSPVIDLLAEGHPHHALRWCADALAAAAGARVRNLRGTGEAPPGPEGSPAMLVAGWTAPDELQHVMAQALKLEVPAVLVRAEAPEAADRVLIPMSGGPHVLQQLWVARALAAARAVRLHAVHVRPGGDGSGPAADLARIYAEAMGVEDSVDVSVAADAVSGIVANIRARDLVVLGAPSHWRAVQHFEGSIPDRIAGVVANPLAMVLSKKSSGIRLRDVFWGSMIRVNLRPRDKAHAIEQLVDTLVTHSQVPTEWRDRLIARALAREEVGSTHVGCATACPHVTVRGFPGMIGCLGICPDGVPFGPPDAPPVHFVFLLVSPEGFYDDYLTVLSGIARIVVRPEVRAALLACDSPPEVEAILRRADE